MLDIVRYLLAWPRNDRGELIFENTQESIFYAIMVKNIKVLVEEIEVLRNLCQKRLYLELQKPDANLDLVIRLGGKHEFYRECIDTAKKLFSEGVTSERKERS